MDEDGLGPILARKRVESNAPQIKVGALWVNTRLLPVTHVRHTHTREASRLCARHARRHTQPLYGKSKYIYVLIRKRSIKKSSPETVRRFTDKTDIDCPPLLLAELPAAAAAKEEEAKKENAYVEN